MRILAKHGVVCLRDQEMTPAQYVAFAKLFGEIEPSTRERYWLPEQNEIYVISNVIVDGVAQAPFSIDVPTEYEDSVNGGVRAGYWFESLPWLGIGLDVSYFGPNDDTPGGPEIDVIPVSPLPM